MRRLLLCRLRLSAFLVAAVIGCAPAVAAAQTTASSQYLGGAAAMMLAASNSAAPAVRPAADIFSSLDEDYGYGPLEDFDRVLRAGGESRRPGPNVPEPMVFDLIRPLGVRKGEFEINVLGFVPLRRTRARSPLFSFITGADRGNQLRPAFEWAPEIEYGVADNFALEFELPMAETQVEAFKGAAQFTFGTAFNEQFIHGLQGILFVDRTNGAVSPTLLYLAAVRLDPVYSLSLQLGFAHEFGGDNEFSPTQVLVNGVLFAETSELWTLGIEVNYAADLDGTAGLLFMPQVHWNPSELVSLQGGVGTRAQEGNTTGEVVFRLVREF